MNRAYSQLSIRTVDEERRILEGVASTPTTDRMGDIVEPLGAQFALPLPLLWQHRFSSPVGWVRSADVTETGIAVRIELARDGDPGPLRDRLEEAWKSVRLGLVRGLSIGFRSIEDADIKGSWGIRFLKWEWLELSLVTIAANQDAAVTIVRAVDRLPPALPGTSRQHSTSHTSAVAEGVKIIPRIYGRK